MWICLAEICINELNEPKRCVGNDRRRSSNPASQTCKSCQICLRNSHTRLRLSKRQNTAKSISSSSSPSSNIMLQHGCDLTNSVDVDGVGVLGSISKSINSSISRVLKRFAISSIEDISLRSKGLLNASSDCAAVSVGSLAASFKRMQTASSLEMKCICLWLFSWGF